MVFSLQCSHYDCFSDRSHATVTNLCDWVHGDGGKRPSELTKTANSTFVRQKLHDCNPSKFTMTIAKSLSTSSQSSKSDAKRAVSFSKSCKFDIPSKQAESGLQSSDTRRRYMRRGSKSPSMFKLQKLNISELEKEWLSSCKEEEEQPRRLSLMSALKLNLEKASIIDTKVVQKVRRMSLEQQRSFTYDILSQV